MDIDAIQGVCRKRTGLRRKSGKKGGRDGDDGGDLAGQQPQAEATQADALPLSVQGQVQWLIQEAVSMENLSQMYIGWMPFL